MITAFLSMVLLNQLPAERPTVNRPRPRVVIVTLRNCAPCEKLKARLKPLMDSPDVDVYVEDLFSWNKRTADTFDVYTAPTVFVWADPRKPGVRLSYQSATLDKIRSALSLHQHRPPPGLPLQTRAVLSSLPFLSVNGLPENAAHHVTIEGDVWLVGPNTEEAWRRHVAEDHGINEAWNMTPLQLARAHSAAHR